MERKIKLSKENLAILPILLLSAILNFANLGIEGYANTYYAAGVKSMLMSFKNFFFVSSDPSGFVTIDKPPLGFWLQTISAKIFGFSGWSIILPQALAGVISVWLIYYLVKRSFGSIAGIISALCLAVTPIFVAASRNNTIDNSLVLALLLACWALLIAAEKGKFKYLLISLIFVGIGFNIKMVEAYMVAPAIYIAYLLSSAIPFKKRFKHLCLGSIILLLVSLSWAFTVDLIPASSRPFVGSSTNNSVIELIIGHNGLERIGLGGRSKDSSKDNIANTKGKQNEAKQAPDFENRNMQNSNAGGFGGMGNNSKPGIFRLFSNGNMSDQISWLLIFSLFGFVAAAIKEKLNFSLDNKKKISLGLWFLWLVPEFIYFSSTTGSFHTYYLTTMAPSIAALSGIGLTTMWEFYKENKWKSWLLPAAFIANTAIEILILSYHFNKPGYKITILITAVLSLIPAIILTVVNIIKWKKKTSQNSNDASYSNNNKYSKNTILSKTLVSIALLGILTAPTVWSATPMFYKMNGSSPSAGLELVNNKQRNDLSTTNDSKLINYLESNRTNEKYLVAVPSANSYASNLILETGEPVMTIGGFSGSDQIITLDQFKQLVDTRVLRYAIVSNNSGRGGFNGGNSNSEISNWIKAHGKAVNNSEWQGSEVSNNQKSGENEERNSVQLYDLK